MPTRKQAALVRNAALLATAASFLLAIRPTPLFAEPDRGEHHENHPHPQQHTHPTPGRPSHDHNHNHDHTHPTPGYPGHNHDHIHPTPGRPGHDHDHDWHPHYDPNGFGPNGHWHPEDRPGHGWIDPHRSARFDPGRGHFRYGIGERLAWNYRMAPLNWRMHGLWAPPSGYYWTQVDNDFVLAAIATGVVASVVANDAPIPPPPAYYPPPQAEYGAGYGAPSGPGGGARIVSSFGGCLDVAHGVAEPGVPLILFRCHGSPNQSWVIGNEQIVGVGGLCLDVRGGTPSPGAGIMVNGCNGAPSQRWSLQNGAITGIAGQCLSLQYGGGADHTPIILAPCDGSPPQQWTVQ